MSSKITCTGGIHMVGSVPFATTEDVLRKTASLLKNHTKRLVDGETGKRSQWIMFQHEVFKDHKEVLREFRAAPKVFSESEIGQIFCKPWQLESQYDEHAIASYHVFTKLRNEGIISPKCRFQVSLPTPMAFISVLVEPALQALVEPHYEAAILRALERIQEHIPASDLSIQWDIAVENGFVEQVELFGKPWWAGTAIEGALSRMIKVASAVNDKVDMGFHFCYGDKDHRHWKEPADLSIPVALAEGVIDSLPRPVQFWHMPVPKDRFDYAYLEPLTKLKPKLGSAELFLGLVHPHDEEGTLKRIEAAKAVVDQFGVATECGLGRTPLSDIDSIFEISCKVSSAVI